MKITFGNNYENIPKTKLSRMGEGYVRSPKMTNEQVKKANLERKLPDDYFFHAYVSSGRGGSLKMFEVTKGYPKLTYGQEVVTPFIPKGLVLENDGKKTYLKEEGSDLKKYNKNIITGFILICAAFMGYFITKK